MKRIALLFLSMLFLVMAVGCDTDAPPQQTTDASSVTSSLFTTQPSSANDPFSTSQPASEEPPASDTSSTSQSTSTEPPASAMPLPQRIPDALPTSLNGFGASSVLTLKNLRTDRAVQQIAIYEEEGDTYLFVTQRIGTDTYLTRCRVNTAQRTATLLDSAKLAGFGHGESMDVSIHNGKLYLFIGYSANTINDSAWCREVVRLCYNKGTITDKKVITGFPYTTQTGEIVFKNATAYRINFGLDDDADQISFYTRCDTGNTGKSIKHRITSYRLSALHQALDACNGTLNMKNMGDTYLASTGNVSSADICSNGSFQGLDVDDKGVIWITGGTTETKPQLSVFQTSKQTIKRSEIKDIAYMVSDKLGAQDFRKTTAYVEIECVKYYKGNYYCVFNPAGDLEMSFTEVYLLQSR